MVEHQKKISELFEKGILVSKDILDKEVNPEVFDKIGRETDLIVLNPDSLEAMKQQESSINWYDVDRINVKSERDNLQNQELKFKSNVELSGAPLLVNSGDLSNDLVGDEFNDDTLENSGVDDKNLTIKSLDVEEGVVDKPQKNPVVEVVSKFNNITKKYTVADFTNVFLTRYRFLESVLRNRQELLQATTISRILSKKERENVSLIGVVEEVAETKSGNIILTLEDMSARIKVLVSKNKKEIFQAAKNIVLDEVIGISGAYNDKFIFVDNVIWPDIPTTNELKKGPEDEYAVFLSDIHVGSNLFLGEEFKKFLSWINFQAGNEDQRKIAKKVKYLFIAGDLVDGVGIYPGQDEELSIKDIHEQYSAFSQLIKQVPDHISIVACPGNHDAVHLAEPQTAFYKEYMGDLFDLPRLTFVTNPAMVNIGKKEGFSGFNVLLYHGYSFDYYISNVESIRVGGGYHRSDLVMKFLLKRRHLAPSFKSTPYFPADQEDPLLIKKIPDFFITGHIHYSCVANYKGVTMISGSCWQGKTSFQEKLGHEPEPARVPVVNLKTREVKIMRFG